MNLRLLVSALDVCWFRCWINVFASARGGSGSTWSAEGNGIASIWRRGGGAAMKPGAWSCQRGEVLTVGHQFLRAHSVWCAACGCFSTGVSACAHLHPCSTTSFPASLLLLTVRQDHTSECLLNVISSVGSQVGRCDRSQHNYSTPACYGREGVTCSCISLLC